MNGYSGCFYQRANAPGAKDFFHHTAIFYYRHFLQIWAECPIGGALREGTIVTESCGLTTLHTFCHC